MSDELHGVLVANALGLGAIQASAHDPMLPNRRRDQRQPGGRYRRRERQNDAAREKYIRRRVSDEQYREGNQVRRPSRQKAERQSGRGGERYGQQQHGPRGRIRQETLLRQGLEGVGVNFQTRNRDRRIRRHPAVARAGLRRHAGENNFARKLPRERRVIMQLFERDARDGRHSRRYVAYAHGAAGVARRRNDHARDFQFLRRFQNGRAATAQAKSFERQRP